MRFSWVTLGLGAVLAVSGCGDDGGGIDAGDANPPDAADGGPPGDAATEDGGPPPSLPEPCDPCRRDSDCGEGSLCLLLDDGERACGRSCTGDGDCGDFGVPATCVEEVAGEPLQCRPNGGTCVVSAPGSDCSGSCSGTYDRCVDAEGLGAVCTTGCRVDADCPIGMRRCRETADGRVCVLDEQAPPVRCAAIAESIGIERCAGDGSCASGVCYGSGSLRLCLPLPEGDGCPDGTRLYGIPDGGDVCLPHLDGLEPEMRAGLDCDCLLEDPGSMLDDTIALAERTRCDLTFAEAFDLLRPEIAHDPFRLSWTDRVIGYWPATVSFSEGVAGDFDAAARDADRPIASTLVVAASLADHPTGAEPPAPGTLADELAMFVTAAGGTPDAAAIAAEAGALDPALANALAGIVAALRVALVARNGALTRLAGDVDRYFQGSVDVPALPSLDMRRSADRGALRGDVDVGAMAGGAAVVAAAIDEAGLAAFAGDAAELTVETPAGRIAVRGAGADAYDDDEWHETALLLDLGGDDVYRFPAGANATVENGVAVVIDLAGSDRYGYDEVPIALDDGPAGHVRLPSDAEGRAAPVEGSNGPISLSTTGRQGSGRLGIGMLVDLGTERDEYRSHRMSQGYAKLGVGLLWDAGGDDLYHAESHAQGAASFGIGLLVDRGGDDVYRGYHAVQGYGYSLGVGVLWDGAGGDEYFMHPSDVLYWSPQDPGGSNSSLGQGAGFGRRADTDGFYMSGGLGFLRDLAGDDRYTAGIFAQGTGYWYGTGVLADGAGNDSYDAQWYVQAGAAHFAVAAFIESSGRDVYNMTARRMNVAIGGGHDFSIAWFVDRDGDDTYLAPGLAFGTGNDGGAGVFADAAGTDSYDSFSDLTFGNANAATDEPFRMMTGTFGYFMEAAGTDTYTRPTPAPIANDQMWTQEAHPDNGERGAGLDRMTGRLGF